MCLCIMFDVLLTKMNKIGLIIIPILLAIVPITAIASEEKTYCDVPNPSNPCHDRKDYNETTRLYTCIDGSHEENWRDCEGGGTGSDDGDNGCQEEDNYCDRDQNCDSPEVDCIDDTKFDEDDYDG
jgi:hypothetical protein